jgi:DNA mismatch repair protein PMS2
MKLIIFRIRVSHQRAAGKASSVLISTQGASMLDNLVLVTGHKSVSNVIPFPRNEESRTTNDTCTPHFKLQGFISSCAHGCGRSTPDKQYYFINGRPCDLPKVNIYISCSHCITFMLDVFFQTYYCAPHCIGL